MPSGVYIRTKPVSLETRKKLSELSKGRVFSKETRKKLSNALMGRIVSEEWRRKIGLSKKGKKYPNRKKPPEKSLEHRRKLSEALSGEKCYKWMGDDVGYSGLHAWVKKNLGKPDTCEHCGKTGLRGHKIHWANKSGEYKREITDWIRLCVKCHSKYDNDKKIKS